MDRTGDQIVPDTSHASDSANIDEDGYVIVEWELPDAEYKTSNVGQTSWLYSVVELVPDIGSYFSWGNAPEVEQVSKFIEEKLKECKDPHDELNSRVCLVKALTKSATNVIEDTELSEEILKRLKSKKCINTRDCEYIMIYKTCSDRMHCLFLLIILRDFRTVLEFLTLLKPETYDEIVSTFEELLKGDPKVTSSCTWCIIKSTVNIVYVVADLLACDCDNQRQKWSNVNREAIGVIGIMDKSESIWDMVDAIVCNKPELKSEVVAVLIKALDACGFHSDIVRLLQEDKNLGRDSLQCRCASGRPSCKETLECETKEVKSPDQEERSADEEIAVNSGPGSLKRKNSECSDKQNGFIKKKSFEDDLNRAGEDKHEGIDNSKRTSTDTDSNSVTRMDDLKIGNPDSDECVCESVNDSLSLAKDTAETEQKCVWVNQEIQTSGTAVPVNSGPGSLKRKNSECSDKQDGRNKKKSHEENLKRADGKDKPKRIDNSKNNDSDSAIRMDNLKIGLPDYDEGVGESIEVSLPVSKDTDETKRKWVCVDQETQTSESGTAENVGASMASSNDTVQPAMRDGVGHGSAMDVPFQSGGQHQGTAFEEGQSDVVDEEFYSLDGSYSVVSSDSNEESQNEPDPFINIHTKFKKRGGNL